MVAVGSSKAQLFHDAELRTMLTGYESLFLPLPYASWERGAATLYAVWACRRCCILSYRRPGAFLNDGFLTSALW